MEKIEKKVFIRQSFTEAGEEEQKIVQGVIDLVRDYENENFKIDLVTGGRALNKTTFKADFESQNNLPFTASNFRNHRLKLLHDSDIFIVVRTGMSESTAFEIAYNLYGGKGIPILYLINENSPINTTLLRELENEIDITYYTFNGVEDLGKVVENFLVEKLTNNIYS
jgi:carbamoyl-phosphate synthase large subunit